MYISDLRLQTRTSVFPSLLPSFFPFCLVYLPPFKPSVAVNKSVCILDNLVWQWLAFQTNGADRKYRLFARCIDRYLNFRRTFPIPQLAWHRLAKAAVSGSFCRTRTDSGSNPAVYVWYIFQSVPFQAKLDRMVLGGCLLPPNGS